LPQKLETSCHLNLNLVQNLNLKPSTPERKAFNDNAQNTCGSEVGQKCECKALFCESILNSSLSQIIDSFKHLATSEATTIELIKPAAELILKEEVESNEELNNSSEEDIKKLITIDTSYLNFGTFFPAKIFKCTIEITNISQSQRVVQLQFDQSMTYSKQLITNEFATSSNKNLSGILAKGDRIVNSEIECKCWYLMQPPSKGFEKALTISLDPSESTKIGVVIKAPQINKGRKFISVLNISLASQDEKEQTLGEDKRELKVLSVAEVETPKLECCKELVYTANNLRVLPLVAKGDGTGDKLRIPFKNNSSQDIEVIFSLVPLSQPKQKTALIDYYCIPSTIKIPAKNMGLLNLCVKYTSLEVKSKGQEKKSIRDQRVLVAKIKNTQMMYCFVLDCTFI